MYFFAISSALLMFLSPFVEEIYTKTHRLYSLLFELLRSVHDHSKFYEINTKNPGVLPSLVTSREKYAYMYRHHRKLLFFSLVSFVPGTVSMVSFAFSNSRLIIIQAFVLLTIAYFIVSLIINLFTKDFDVRVHRKLVTNWRPSNFPTVDIFLPIAGEPIEVLNNTWEGVSQLQKRYEGVINVYCLDDGASSEVQLLSQQYGFNYMVRPNRGEFKKAGNLRYGFEHSTGDFIAIFDADFRPRFDFLNELLPYFYNRPELGIVQSPQYFDVRSEQNWLERGAGAVQELFYKHSQVSRQTFDAAICVGSNAIYRRQALNDIGGTALIEHSEDVHTGFNLGMKGWKLQYVPIVLAKGLCPSTMQAFFKQQYRWCLGSMTLLTSKKFWRTKLSFRARLSYVSGFMYYIHTAISAVLVPFIPLVVLVRYDSHVNLMNFFLIAPSLFFVIVVVPLWHKATYGVEAWSTRLVYGWAHLFAIYDYITGNRMQWKPTGGKMNIDIRYVNFRIMQFVFNFIPAVAWVGIAGYKIVAFGDFNFVPIFIGGLYYLMIAYKVVFFVSPKEAVPLQSDKTAQGNAYPPVMHLQTNKVAA
jgi:cellulose synthase (UDP-forming)